MKNKIINGVRILSIIVISLPFLYFSFLVARHNLVKFSQVRECQSRYPLNKSVDLSDKNWITNNIELNISNIKIDRYYARHEPGSSFSLLPIRNFDTPYSCKIFFTLDSEIKIIDRKGNKTANFGSYIESQPQITKNPVFTNELEFTVESKIDIQEEFLKHINPETAIFSENDNYLLMHFASAPNKDKVYEKRFNKNNLDLNKAYLYNKKSQKWLVLNMFKLGQNNNKEKFYHILEKHNLKTGGSRKIVDGVKLGQNDTLVFDLWDYENGKKSDKLSLLEIAFVEQGSEIYLVSD